MEQAFYVEDETKLDTLTFARERFLPSLPVPQLDETLQKYLDSCKPVVSGVEYRNTEEIVKNFLKNEGPILQKMLLQRAESSKNWLEEWWLNGYLDFRAPAGMLNFAGVANFDFWPYQPGSQLQHASLLAHCTLKFWNLLRNEKFKQIQDKKGNWLSMRQFRFIFNTSRVPCKNRDKLYEHFKSKYEGDCSTHIIIFYRKRMYKVDVIARETGELLTPGQWYHIFTIIKQNKIYGPGISMLSELDRDTWAEAREHLITLSKQNEINIKDIETAIICFTLVDDHAKTFTELFTLAASGCYGDHWTDKVNFLITSCGQLIANNDHTPLDGMAFVTTMFYIQVLLREKFNYGTWDKNWEKESVEVDLPIELNFVTDNKINAWIQQGIDIVKNFRELSTFYHHTFEKFGKLAITELGVHPCAFVEICIQLAYMRRHGHPASTYETASTRQFYHGRTETIRTCTPEAVDFCNAIIKDLPNKTSLFMKACKKYVRLMNEAKSGKGCDRHLMGLSIIAQQMHGMELPEVFCYPSYRNSGGGANFILSTSLAGYGNCDGATPPMRKDGYGCFFRMSDQNIHYITTTYDPTPGVDAAAFSKGLEKSLIDVYNVIYKPTARL